MMKLLYGENVVFRSLSLVDCRLDMLRSFNRYQEVRQCWRKVNDEWVLKDIAFIEDWNDDEKQHHAISLEWCLHHGGKVIGAYIGGALIGFANVDAVFFGVESNYLQLGMLYVSSEHRGKGIGKVLFEHSVSQARMMGADKLYISAHSSKETQEFYKAVGCVEAVEINQMAVEREPYDCQMEYDLQDVLQSTIG